jgi:putative colanic acid biosynthesis glycosyltransferase WcaI
LCYKGEFTENRERVRPTFVKILYVSQYFPPEMGAPAARVAELSRHWVKAGHEVTVLTGFPNHPTGVVPAEYRRRMRRLVVREDYEGVHVLRTWLLPFPNRGAFRRMLNYGSFCLSSAISGLSLPRPDVVIATSPQLLVGLSGWWLSRCKGVPFVFEVRDLWPESLAAVGMGRENSVLHDGLAKIAGFLYRRCEHVVVVSPAFRAHLAQHWRLSPDKISVVQNGVETALFTPQRPWPEGLRDIEGRGKFIVSYIGTMGMAHGLEMVLEVAARLRSSNPEMLFLLVGEGAEKQNIISLARARGLTNLRFVDQQPREEVPAYLCASDLSLVLLRKTDLFKTVIPTKLLECMSCGRPVILGVDGQARELMEEANAGIFVEPENADALSHAILQLAADPPMRHAMGANGRRYILERLSRGKTALDYLQVLEEIVAQRSVKAAAGASSG